MSVTKEARRRGPQHYYPDQGKMSTITIRVTAWHRDKYKRLGGAEWFRAKVEEAKE